MKYYSFIFALIIIGVFIFQLVIPGLTDAFLLDQSSFQQPWRFITAIFLHGGAAHLLYNLFALLLFGFILERLIGGRRFVMVFFVSGILANVFSVFFYPSALGASGAIFGIIGALTMIRPLMTVWAFSLPMPLFLASMFWVVGDVLGVFFPQGVANLAHLAGLGFGLLIGVFLRERRADKNSYGIKLDEGSMRRWEDTFMR